MGALNPLPWCSFYLSQINAMFLKLCERIGTLTNKKNYTYNTTSVLLYFLISHICIFIAAVDSASSDKMPLK